MPLRKKPDADLRARYPIYVEIGLIAALVLLIVAFRSDWSSRGEFEIVMPEQEQIEIEEIQQTRQIEQPPPPPRPPVPVVVPDDEVLDDEALDLDASLDLNAPVASTPPPPEPREETQEEEPEFFMAVEEMPEPIGGMAGIYERANRYPEMARRAGVEGRVVVQFIVDENGDVRDPVVLSGVGAGLDEVAVEAVRNTKFTPGKQRSTPVPVKMSIQIRFSLQ